MKSIQLVSDCLVSVGVVAGWDKHFCPSILIEGLKNYVPLNGAASLICPEYQEDLDTISSILSRRGIRYRLVS